MESQLVVQPRDKSSLVQVVGTSLLFFVLSVPLALALLNLVEEFNIQIDSLPVILEHPVARVFTATMGGLVVWSLVRPTKQLANPSPNPWKGLSEYSLEDAGVTIRPLTEQRLQDILEQQGTVYLHTGSTPPTERDLLNISEHYHRPVHEPIEEEWLEESEGVSSEPTARFDLDQPPLLTIELVPRTCWFSNLRSGLTVEQWRALRRRVYKRAGYRCQICDGRGPNHPVEAHETWSYDDVMGVQRLECVRALCPACHTVKHFGLATIRGKEDMARRQLMTVNKWSVAMASSYIEYSFSQWRERSQRTWSLDFSHLEQYGYTEQEIAELKRARVEH